MTLRLKTPGQLLAAIPAMLGTPPTESLVLVGIGAGGQVSPIARVDIDGCRTPEGARALARECTGILARAGARTVMVAAYSDAADAGDVVSAVRRGLDHGFEVTDTWVVANGRYRSPDCADPACCPRLGMPLPQVSDDAQSAYRHVAPRTEGSHRDHVGAPRVRRKSARDALRRAQRARVKGDARWRAKALDQWRAAVRDALEGRAPADARTGRLAAALLDVYVRDAIVVDMVPGHAQVATALCVDHDDSGVREALSRMIGSSAPIRPDHEAIEATVALAEHVAWLCPEAAAPAYALVAIARWWNGDDDSAAVAAADAMTAEPGYRLAELVVCALEVSMPPGWLRAS